VVPSQERAGRQMVLRLTTSCEMRIGSRVAGSCCVWPACLSSVLTSLVWQTAASTWALSRRLFAVSHDWRAGPVNSGSVAQVRLLASVLCADLWWTSLAVHHSCLLKKVGLRVLVHRLHYNRLLHGLTRNVYNVQGGEERLSDTAHGTEERVCQHVF